jgi:hypothetical protein
MNIICDKLKAEIPLRLCLRKQKLAIARRVVTHYGPMPNGDSCVCIGCKYGEDLRGIYSEEYEQVIEGKRQSRRRNATLSRWEDGEVLHV